MSVRRDSARRTSRCPVFIGGRRAASLPPRHSAAAGDGGQGAGRGAGAGASGSDPPDDMDHTGDAAGIDVGGDDTDVAMSGAADGGDEADDRHGGAFRIPQELRRGYFNVLAEKPFFDRLVQRVPTSPRGLSAPLDTLHTFSFPGYKPDSLELSVSSGRFPLRWWPLPLTSPTSIVCRALAGCEPAPGARVVGVADL